MKDQITDSMYLMFVYALLFIVWFFLLSDKVSAESIDSQIKTIAIEHGVNPDLAVAIAEVESELNERAVGALGEIGLFQLRPEYHRVVKGNTRQNIEAAMAYLADLQRTCSSYGDAYFVCFNYGTARRLRYPKLYPYYLKVMAARTRRQMIAATDR